MTLKTYPNLINESFKEIIERYAKDDFSSASRNNHPDDVATLARMRVEILEQMKASIRTLANPHLTGGFKISQSQANWAGNAIRFYEEKVHILPFQKMTQIFSELTAIDYSKLVEKRTIKPGTTLTQMQMPNEMGEVKTGSFYAPGTLPNQLEDRASKSGIHHKTTYIEEGTPHTEPKGLYPAKPTANITVLASTASSAVDGWSVINESFLTSGGGSSLECVQMTIRRYS